MNDNNLDKYFFTESAKEQLKRQVGKENFELIIAGKLFKEGKRVMNIKEDLKELCRH